MGQFQLDKYKIYCLRYVDTLISVGKIRDEICKVHKGEQMTKKELLEN